MLKKFFKAIVTIVTAFLVFALCAAATVSADNWSKETDGSTYYLTDSGEKLTGFQRIGENSYFFGEDGKMWTCRWLTTATGTKYYFKKDGTMATGKLKIGSETYEFAADGKLLVLNLWSPFDGLSWDVSQEKIIKTLNLNEDDYFLEDDFMIVITDGMSLDSESMFICDVYVTADEQLSAFGSVGIYSDETKNQINDAFKDEGFLLAGSSKEDDLAFCYYISENNIGGIVYSDSFIIYLIISDKETQDMINSLSASV